MNYKKLVSAALTATTVLWMVGAAALPLANAQTTASLQAQIAALLAQIQTLQAQLNSTGSTTTTGTATTYDFTSDLTVGSTGAQVTELQQFLINKGYLTAVSAPTGYFGALTQAALGKFQAAVGISPTAGYFGPKTMAYMNSLSSSSTTTTTTTTTTTSGSLPAGCTSSTGYSPTTGASCATGTTTVVAPSTGLQVSLASSNPAAGSLISSAGSGSGRVPVLAFNLTAGNSGAVTVSALSFQQEGVLSESAISGAYLIQNGQVVAQYSSLNNDTLSFNGLQLSIPAGQTETYELAINIAGGLSAGNTTSFALPAASDVTAWDTNNNAITPAGSFPLNGNVFTVTTVSNPSLATLAITSSSIGTSVTAGTQGNIVGAWTFTVQNSPVWLQNINFHVIGSANVANIQNVKLLVNGVQLGATLPSVPANGQADFSATSTSVELNTGSNNVQVVADIMGSPSDNFQFEILNNYDVLAVDSQYNVPISVANTAGTGTEVFIQTGQITLNQDPNTPTGNIAKGVSGTVLAKYDLYAAGEPVKVQFLDFNIHLTGVATTTGATTLSSQLQNIAITDDAGDQVGTTINQPPSSNICTPTNPPASAGLSSGTITASTVVYNDCFGSSGSPINYIVPANTTRVLSLKADIESTANFSTITANLTADTNNLQGMVSSQSGSTSGASGVALTLVSSSLAASQNNALGTQNVSAGTTNLEIGSYALSASSAGGVNVNTVSIELAPSSTNGGLAYTVPFQNLKLLINGTQFGTTQGVVTGNSTYSFSGSAFNVPAGQTVNVNVYADTLSSGAGVYSPATSLTGFTGVGQTSYTSVSDTAGTIAGQNISFSGQPALTIGLDSTNPPAGQIVQGSTGNTLAVFRFTETSNVENVKVTQLNVVQKVASTSTVKSAYSNVQLWNGSTMLGTAQSPVADASGTGYIYNFNSFSTPLIVPAGQSVSLTLKGNLGTYTSGSFTDNSTSTFEIATTTDASNSTSSLTVVALGATSNRTALVTLSNAVGSPMTVLQTTLTPSLSDYAGITQHNSRSTQDKFATLSFAVNAANAAALNTVTLTFSGNLISSSSTFLPGVDLLDPNGVSVTSDNNGAGSILSSSTGSNSNGYFKTWTFATSTSNIPQFSAGTNQNFTVVVNDNLGTAAATNGISYGLQVNLQNTTDLTFYDGLGAQSTLVPSIPVSTQSYTLPLSTSISFISGS
ncbi:MAG TPA: peptidoglycan-binding domain-containing protein [Candidatus Paceibacterota bacterium]|nr:peptidoglycan-binding domain-containing protein [Candidatus Paceibacterota bacterium]